MPRKSPRDDDDFSDVEEYDEDGRPLRKQRRRETEGNGMPLWVFGGLGVGAVLVIAVIVFLVRSGHAERQRAMEAERAAQAERERLLAMRDADVPEPRVPRPKPPNPIPRNVVGENWSKAFGKWQRTPARNDTDYPYFFDFRLDHGVTMTRTNFDGTPKSQEATAQVHIDEGETLSLILHVGMGTYSYSFHVKPDGTLVLNDGKGGLVFTRAK